jgi:hypothetical protein
MHGEKVAVKNQIVIIKLFFLIQASVEKKSVSLFCLKGLSSEICLAESGIIR